MLARAPSENQTKLSAALSTSHDGLHVEKPSSSANTDFAGQVYAAV